MSPYNDTWKIHRKIVTKVASSNKSIAAFDRAQEIESAHFLLNVLDSPEKLLEHLQKEAGSVVLRITYGYTTVAHGVDPLVEVAAKSMHDFSISTVPGMWMVDYLPFRTYTFCHGRHQLMRSSEICSGLASRHCVQEDGKADGNAAEAMHRPALRMGETTDAREEAYHVICIRVHRRHWYRRRDGLHPQVGCNVAFSGWC